MSARTLKQFCKASDARAEAGDRLHAYLVSLPAQTAIAVATRVEYLLALEWEAEQKAMLKVGDHTSWVFSISNKELADARTAFDSVRSSDSDTHAEQHAMALLSAFDLDEAWWTARRTRQEILGWFRVRGEAA